ncbi:MAG: DUF692 domain-containing protein, partial [Acidobacteriota bacterium]|nr:DUF692 domain-containing protein [Acidobacteriota bacterium]
MMVNGPRSASRSVLPTLGVGLGYRAELHDLIVAHESHIDFLEVITEQFIRRGPEPGKLALELHRQFPIIPHGVDLSIGTAAGTDEAYVSDVCDFVDSVKAPWFSDHLAFTRVPGANIGQLTQLWFTEESLEAVSRNVRRLKLRTSTPFLLENITYYFKLSQAEMTEAEFISRVLHDTDCGMLLDVNNIHINSVNLKFD